MHTFYTCVCNEIVSVHQVLESRLKVSALVILLTPLLYKCSQLWLNCSSENKSYSHTNTSACNVLNPRLERGFWNEGMDPGFWDAVQIPCQLLAVEEAAVVSLRITAADLPKRLQHLLKNCSWCHGDVAQLHGNEPSPLVLGVTGVKMPRIENQLFPG